MHRVLMHRVLMHRVLMHTVQPRQIRLFVGQLGLPEIVPDLPLRLSVQSVELGRGHAVQFGQKNLSTSLTPRVNCRRNDSDWKTPPTLPSANRTRPPISAAWIPDNPAAPFHERSGPCATSPPSRCKFQIHSSNAPAHAAKPWIALLWSAGCHSRFGLLFDRLPPSRTNPKRDRNTALQRGPKAQETLDRPGGQWDRSIFLMQAGATRFGLFGIGFIILHDCTLAFVLRI